MPNRNEKRSCPRIFFRIEWILFFHVSLPVVRVVAASLCVVALWRTRELGEKQLRDSHARAQYDRDTIEIGELERDIEEVSGIDDPRGIVHDEPESCERALAREMNEIFFTSEIVCARAEDTHPGMQYKVSVWLDDDLSVFREDLLYGVDHGCPVCVDGEELVTEQNIVARGLYPGLIEVREGDVAGMDGGDDLVVGEVHNREKRISPSIRKNQKTTFEFSSSNMKLQNATIEAGYRSFFVISVFTRQ